MGRNSESIEDASFDISTKSIVHKKKKKTCLCFTTAKLILIHLQSFLEGDVKGLKSRWIRKKERECLCQTEVDARQQKRVLQKRQTCF